MCVDGEGSKRRKETETEQSLKDGWPGRLQGEGAEDEEQDGEEDSSYHATIVKI